MAADDQVIEVDPSADAAPSLGASLGPLPVVEVELVSASASPAQSGGWAKVVDAGATLRVCRGDNVIFTVRLRHASGHLGRSAGCVVFC